MITQYNLHELKKKLALQHDVSVKDIIIDSLDDFEFDYNGKQYVAKLGNDEREGIEHYHNSVYFINSTRADNEVVFDERLNRYFIANIADKIPALNPTCIFDVDVPFFRYWYSDDADWEYYYGNMPKGSGPHFLTAEELIKLGKAALVSLDV